MIMQDVSNKVEFGCNEKKILTLFNKKQYVIRTQMVPNREPVGKFSVNDTNIYVHLDKLNNNLFNENPYTLVELTYEVMGISNNNILDWIKISKARSKFVSDIEDKFSIGVWIYSRKGTLVNWYAVWRIEHSQYHKHSYFIAMCDNAMKSAPEYLLHCQTNDDIYTISRALGRSKRLCKAIIGAVMPDWCVPLFTKPVKET